MFLYKQIFAGLEFCPDPVSCMRRASEGGFAYISWKVSLLDFIFNIIFKRAPRPSVPVLSCQIFQQDTIARNFIDGYGKKQIYQVFFLTKRLDLLHLLDLPPGQRLLQHPLLPCLGFPIRITTEARLWSGHSHSFRGDPIHWTVSNLNVLLVFFHAKIIINNSCASI